MELSIVILAAGQGKRMRSQVPKVLHRLAGKTLLEHVVCTAEKLNPDQVTIVVYGHRGDAVPHALANLNEDKGSSLNIQHFYKLNIQLN